VAAVSERTPFELLTYQETAMKKLLLITLFFASSAAFADTYVQGYTRSDGTYVQGHYRSDANSIRSDNYSSQGNTNPYTGQQGSQRNEYSNPPTYNQGQYNNNQSLRGMGSNGFR